MKIVRTMTADMEEKVKNLGDFQKNLTSLGEKLNYEEALKLIDQAVANGIREVDILLGFLAPLLAKQTEAAVSEVNFYSESVSVFSLKLIETLRIRAQSNRIPGNTDVLLAVQSDNKHTLGIQLLELWLCAENISTRSFVGNDTEIVDDFIKQKPKIFGLSLSETSQLEAARSLINKIKSMCDIPPLFIVGGVAVKLGQILSAQIPEASLVSDNSKLFLTIKTHLSLGFLYNLKLKGF